MRNNRGFALTTVLILGVAIFVMGVAGFIATQLGYASLTAEQRYHMLEKAANYGLMKLAESVSAGNNCSGTQTYSVNSATVEVQAISAGGSCFLWSRATMGQSKVVKVAVITSGNPSTYGAVSAKLLNNLSLGGSGAIVSCDPDCRTSALMIGNNLTIDPTENLVSTCPNNPKGVTALIDPFVENVAYLQQNFTNRVFDANDRQELINKLSQLYNVEFSSNGTPQKVKGAETPIADQNGNPLILSYNPVNPPSYDVCTTQNYTGFNNCTASGNIITCENKIKFVWSNGRYAIQLVTAVGSLPANTNLAYCNHLYLGQNATLNINGFTGGNTVAVNQVNLNGNVSSASGYQLNLVARNTLQDQSNNITVTNVNVFVQNITLDNNGLKWEGGILYSGGTGTGNFNINLRANSYLGSDNNPVLIIVDNNINIGRNGNASINGLIYATEGTNNLSVGDGNGNFKINGALISQATNFNINISGNFEIRFSADVIRKLNQRYSFVRPPQCGTTSVRVPFIQTKMTVY